MKLQHVIMTLTAVTVLGIGCGGDAEHAEGHKDSGDHSQHTTQMASAEAHLDPVCGMWISDSSATTVSKDGQTFAFCMVGHQEQFAADSSKYFEEHKSLSVQVDEYRVYMHVMTMESYQTMISGMGHGGHGAAAPVGSHHMTLEIKDALGTQLGDAVVTVKAVLEGGSDQIVKAKSVGGFYGVNLDLSASGAYTLETMFTLADGQRRSASMSFDKS